MSFNVTQCPACESTFNTNSRVLNAAAGKVRCGACLNVFEAIDHFLLPDADDETTLEHGESVFVGNNPQEFFDPSRFLTRSALTEPSNNESTAIETVDEQDLHDKLERSEAVSEDFFATVAGELHSNHDTQKLSAIEAKLGSENDDPPLEQPDQATEQVADAIIDERFEEEILDSFDAQAQTTPEQPTPDETEQTTDTEASFSAAAEPDLETDPEQQHRINEDLIENEGEVGQETTENFAAQQSPSINDRSFTGIELSASFSFDPRLAARTKQDDIEDNTQPDSESIQEQEEQSEAVARDKERLEQNEEQFLNAVSEELEQNSLPENDAPQSDNRDSPAEYLSADDSPGETEAQNPDVLSDDTPELFLPKEVASEPAATNLEVTDEDNSSRIDLSSVANSSSEADIQREDIAAPEEGVHTNTEPRAAAELIEGSVEAEAQAAEIALTEQAASIATEQALKTELDEDSTEAIRARALETELNDEQALEAIPQENLAALGAMSTPLELLSRKESRLLRNALLSLSIVILSGLLSGQYLWRHKDLYSQLPQLRPLYEQACTMLDCDLPDYTDIDSIRSENLTVRTHPTFTNGLMVNTIIRNTAAFDQPFPLLILSFNSAANNVIALREFSPSEYLESGLRSVQSMPPTTPIQIGLAIMDPGPEAVNYTLAFRWP
ncbi:MAG: DUF3426 domain-containing protein [Pseudomonadales bacterium]|jgi:predicted Zn finger-like uncharacterized protein|nr:DUF3426 domain-containing protein [Pseudomonadales bacterium]MDB3908732.1 DUF3426 domain-containing protein [Gammaproteobacteria bacterium]